MTTDRHLYSSPIEPYSTAVLSFGSNCGDRIGNVRKALDWMHESFSDAKESGIYETPEIHGVGNPYINAVGICNVACSLDEFTAMTKRYEHENGRDAECRRRGDVPIDIDVVLWNDEIVRQLDYTSSFFKIGYAMIAKDQNLAVRR